MEKQFFIKTTHAETYEKLLSEGFVLVSFDGTAWTFLNDKSKTMSFDNKEIIFSDKLCF